MKRWIFAIFSMILVGFAANATVNDGRVVTTVGYVTHEMGTLQDKIPSQTGTKAMTFGDEAGKIGAREVKTDLGTSTSDDSLPTVGAVNDKLDDKQNEIPAKNTNTVLTYTGVEGNVGEKGIYQNSGSYAGQMDNLVTAGTFNAALKNGLDNEFVCVENDPNEPDKCWLWTIDNTSAGTKPYISAVGTLVNYGTPTPSNPIYPRFFQQGDMILRKLDNTYVDSYDATTGKITRKVGVKVFDGTEHFQVYGTIATDDYRFLYNIRTGNSDASSSLCSHIDRIIQSATYNQTNRPCIRYNTPGTGITFYLEDNSATLSDFKTFLAEQYAAGTPVTVWYPLATPVEENWTETTYNENIYMPQNQ